MTGTVRACVAMAGVATLMSVATVVAAQDVTSDAGAALFQRKCAACHTVGGGKFTDAPDLNVVVSWPAADLTAAIRRMEKNVGPLADPDVATLVALLQSPDARSRLAAEQQRLLHAIAASVAPGDARRGRALFAGSTRLGAGGLPCASCHTAAGAGGTFAVDLTGVATRLGQAALVSAIQSASFPVMQAAYRAHPIATQEAADLAEYFKSIDSPVAPPARPDASGPPIGTAGVALATLALGGVWIDGRRRRAAGTRARLVARATGADRAMRSRRA